jgi:hypothetical protein
MDAGRRGLTRFSIGPSTMLGHMLNGCDDLVEGQNKL